MKLFELLCQLFAHRVPAYVEAFTQYDEDGYPIDDLLEDFDDEEGGYYEDDFEDLDTEWE